MSRIEAAARVTISARECGNLEDVLIYLRMVQNGSLLSAKQRKALWTAVATDCEKCAKVLLRLREVRRQDERLALARRSRERVLGADDLSLVWGVDEFRQKRGTAAPRGAESIGFHVLDGIPALLDQLNWLGDLARFQLERDAASEESRAGRRPDHDQKVLIQELYGIYKRSGGKAKVYRVDAKEGGGGHFHAMVAEIMDQIGFAYHGKDALAQAIRKALLERPRRY
jgi:hypothetical protein